MKNSSLLTKGQIKINIHFKINVMKYFLLQTQSDKGKHYLKTNASDKETAINNFCSLYNAPKQAVLNVWEFDLMWWGFKPKTIIEKLGTKI